MMESGGPLGGSSGPSWASPEATSRVSVVEQHEQEMLNTVHSTLDEPVRETIMRDVNAVASKLRVVVMPMDQRTMLLSTASYAAVVQQDGAVSENDLSEGDRIVLQRLKDWDLWGPLILCLALAVVLSFKAPSDQTSLVFAAVFCAVWAGGTVVTVNAQLLGGTISFFQSLCVLGYSIFPLTLAAMVIGILKLVIKTWIVIDMIFVAVGMVWALRSSAVFISLYVRPERRLLALYPVFFFYTFLGWMILLF